MTKSTGKRIATDAEKRLRQRQGREKKLAKMVISILIDEGFSLSVHDGEELAIIKCRDKKQVLAAMMSTDEDSLWVYRPGVAERYGWLYFVYGNDGYDVINDHTTNLEELLGPVTAEIDKMQEEVCA